MSVRGQWLDRLPDFMRSARFRMTVLYSTVLFVLAALLVGTLYFALLMSLDDSMVRSRVSFVDLNHDGTLTDSEVQLETDIEGLVRLVNSQTLENLKSYSFAALGVLFVISLGVGWVVAGRTLAPIGRITDVANHIQATDLSQRIELEGPSDELKRLADTFDRMLARLDDAFAMQRRFVADASHELRNPLAIIKTNLDVALADPDVSKEELERAGSVARRATERMASLVDDLFALARLDSRTPVSDDLSLTALVAEVGEELEALAVQHRLRLRTDFVAQVTIEGDEEGLKRAVANLVDNAIRYAPEDSEIVLAAGVEASWAWISVTDQGPGIPTEQQERVFDRFWRADVSRSRDRGGTGLGLAIVRQIAQAHRGSVQLLSEPGHGSTFIVWLPVRAEEGVSLPPIPTRKRPGPGAQPGSKTGSGPVALPLK
ncbi:MAG: HAMP domain-containing histidine kinase [Actinomycetota bacterium]|nr:HAMP domain-containing histidine kinase [Actinomycetota bacterium]